jgi:hypothetical protein
MRSICVWNFSSSLKKISHWLISKMSRKKSFVVRLFKKSVGIFFELSEKLNLCLWRVVQKWCHWRSKIFLIIKCLETRSGVSVVHQIVLKSSSRVPNILAESNTISKSCLGTQNPTTPGQKSEIANIPSRTQQNHKISRKKNQQNISHKKKHFLISEFFCERLVRSGFLSRW